MPEYTTPNKSHTMQFRVRYCETDAMGFFHHSHYINYFEVGRTELFRESGGNYREMEENGLYFVVVDINIRYRKPARYDDVLTLITRIKEITPAKLIHEYEVYRDNIMLTQGKTTLACVDRNGVVQKISSEIIPTLMKVEGES